MTKIIAFKPNKSCPVHLSGFLVKRMEDYNFKNRYSDTTLNIDASLNQEWYKGLPSELVFVTWDRIIAFDIKKISTGDRVYLISQKFLDIIKKFDILDETWVFFKVNLVYEKNKRMAEEKYYVIQKKVSKRYRVEQVLEGTKSIIKNVDLDEVEFGYENDIYEEEKKAYKVVFNEKASDDLFLVEYDKYPPESNIYRYLYCSNAFAEELKKVELNGCQIIDTEEIGMIDPVDLKPYEENMNYLTEL
ncbi:hypothetical protein [Listeria booriae]|uniref:Immunity protein 43 domain-containing protein n=1 Tax=Listeria booriae TaxID=1552123 RepID=A0A842F2R1_9LIST|nr:hypothetical protein [Listeria booriae]MBC2098125.1 hypothetical protein [Listeria booriae]MBC2149342.1 hypothetical protein [Listeria booriae]MBC2241655.1 hypothetical protein [Listeria booriae]